VSTVESFKSETFTLFTNSKARTDSIERMSAFVDALPLDDTYRAIIKKGEMGRRDVANKLYQIGIGQVVKSNVVKTDTEGESSVAGWSKYHILLPMKFVSAAETDDDELRDKAEFERELCDMLIQRYQGNKLYRAYDRAIRSKDCKVRLFSNYFSRFVDVWTAKGVGFKFRPSEADRVLGDKAA